MGHDERELDGFESYIKDTVSRHLEFRKWYRHIKQPYSEKLQKKTCELHQCDNQLDFREVREGLTEEEAPELLNRAFEDG